MRGFSLRDRKIFIVFVVSIFVIAGVNIIARGADVQYPKAKLVVEVVDEENRPIEGAVVSVGFETPKPAGTGWGVNTYSTKSITDKEGKCAIEGYGTNYVSFGAKKDGYYKSYGEPIIFETKSNDRWEPWGKKVKLILKKIILPVPMYAKIVNVEIPALDKQIGFDLEKGDWVFPHGNGTTADLIFQAKKRVVDWRDYEATLQITFSNDGDGILETKINRWYGSQLKLERFAPEYGYKAVFLKSVSSSRNNVMDKIPDSENKAFCLRLRTKKGGDKIVEASYGKIMGDIGLYPESFETAKIKFKYYFNPDRTRNLEFDPSKNLFQNLKSSEEVDIDLP